MKILWANFEFEKIGFSDSCVFCQLGVGKIEVIDDHFLLLCLIKETSLMLLLFLDPLGLLVSQFSFFVELCGKFLLELICLFFAELDMRSLIIQLLFHQLICVLTVSKLYLKRICFLSFRVYNLFIILNNWRIKLFLRRLGFVFFTVFLKKSHRSFLKLSSDGCNLLGLLDQSIMMVILDGLNKNTHIWLFHWSFFSSYHWYISLFTAFEFFFRGLISKFSKLELQVAVFSLCHLTQFLIMNQLLI